MSCHQKPNPSRETVPLTRVIFPVQVSYQFPVGLGGGPVQPLLMGGPGQGGPPTQQCQARESFVIFCFKLKNLYIPAVLRIRIRDEQPGSYFRELKKQFFGLKYLNFLMKIRDGKNSVPG
jgi:hypothetical protein